VQAKLRSHVLLTLPEMTTTMSGKQCDVTMAVLRHVMEASLVGSAQITCMELGHVVSFIMTNVLSIDVC
jgi:hypothetical protein